MQSADWQCAHDLCSTDCEFRAWTEDLNWTGPAEPGFRLAQQPPT